MSTIGYVTSEFANLLAVLAPSQRDATDYGRACSASLSKALATVALANREAAIMAGWSEEDLGPTPTAERLREARPFRGDLSQAVRVAQGLQYNLDGRCLKPEVGSALSSVLTAFVSHLAERLAEGR